MFSSDQITSAKVLTKATSTTSSIGLAEFQALISTTVLQDLDTQIGMYKSKIEASSAEKKALAADISKLNGKIATPQSIDVKSGKTGETKNFSSVKLTNAEYAELKAYAKSKGLSIELSNSTNLQENYGESEYVSEEFKTSVKNKLSGLKKDQKAVFTTLQVNSLCDENGNLKSKKDFDIAVAKLPKNLQSKATETYQNMLEERGMIKDPNNQFVSVEFLKTFSESLETRMTDLNSQSETDSIRFQALMDSRKQNLLMLSNMMNSDNQTKMAIINNMK